MNTPDNLKYSKEHEWVRVDGEHAYIGVTDFAQDQLGDIVYVEIETEGQTLAKDEVFGTVEAVKTVSDLYMPVGGTIEEINSELEGEPEFVNTDPYEKGWMIKVKMDNTAELEELMDAAAYTEMTAQVS